MKAKTMASFVSMSFAVVVVIMGMVSAASAQNLLSGVDLQDLQFGYYQDTCGDFEEIVSKKVKQWFQKDHTIAPSLIRLHFHDCAVRGCDASILLNTPGSERTAAVSKTLRGFEVIEEIKAELEKKCPKTVSCADILTAAARDSTVLLQGPFWANQYGRKDGKQSYAKEANSVPRGHENVTYLIEFFQSKGLSMLDLVVLSGAHTIGRTTCGSIQDRLYNHKGTGKPDATLDPKYHDFLRRKCRVATNYADLDPTTPKLFDNVYYMNLAKNMGTLFTDQVLQSDARTTGLVNSFATQPTLFPYMFSASMVRLGNVVQEEAGEVRLHCSRVNR